MQYATDFVIDELRQSFVPSVITENDVVVRLLANYIVLAIGAVFFYLSFATASFMYFFNWRKETFYPDTLPKDLSEQVKTEIGIALRSLPFMAIPMAPFPTLLQMGYGKLYYDINDYGWGYVPISLFLFLIVTDFSIYWIHRILHWPIIYKYIHKPHHTYRYTTPFSSHAFHPLDGWAQGVSYYLFCFLFPFHHIVFVVTFVFVNFWTISIHDQVDFCGDGILNSTGHHTIHHTDFLYNYGQYTTIWDRAFGTYRPAHQTHNISDLLHVPTKKNE